ncbi:hypothetical protein GQ457_03G017070 [Hibiscus cannabinus]
MKLEDLTTITRHVKNCEGNMKKDRSKSVLMGPRAKGKVKKVEKSKGNGKTKPKGKEALKPKGGVSKMENVSIAVRLDIEKETARYLRMSRRLKQLEHQFQGLHTRRTLAKGDVDLRVWNGARVAALAVGTYVFERRISKLHKDGLLDPFAFEQLDVCESCLLEKMTKAPFSGKGERASDLLGLIHSDVCGPMNTQARGGYQYFITFTDDFSRYGYIYLMRHKSEALEKFKEFKNEVQNQHGKSIKALRSDRGGEYLSQDFDKLLKECGIVSQLTPPGTPQWNGGYALETTAFTLNRVPSKSVQKTPHEILNPNPKNVLLLDIPRKLRDTISTTRTKCLLLELEYSLKGIFANSGKGRNIELKEVQEQQDIEPEVEEIPLVVEENPIDLETQPLRRSTRERHEPERYGFLVTTHGDVILVDQDEPKTYQEAVASPDSEKWLEAMRSEMDSMSDNQGFNILLRLDDKGDVSARDNGSSLDRLSRLGSDLGRASYRVIGVCLSPNNYSTCLYTVPSTVELSPHAIRCRKVPFLTRRN